jgi:hypothetical protein
MNCCAWKALVAEGRSLEDIAADFGVTPLVVKRRLRWRMSRPACWRTTSKARCHWSS